MKRRLLLSLSLVAVAGMFSLCAWAGEPTPHEPQQQGQVVVLRNGEVLSGRVLQDGEHYKIVREGSEIRLAAREVELVANSLDEAYEQLKARKVSTVDDHVRMAQWCMRHKLLGYAAKEIMEVMQKDPRDPRIAQLDAQLTRLREQAVAPVADQPAPKKTIPPASPEELERLVRTLPAGTVENFTGTIQPLLLNNCANSGCHAPGATSSFTLLNPPTEGVIPRRLTQRNLYNTLQFVDYADPQQSKLLVAACQAHGTARVAVFGMESEQYADLLNWIAATGRGFRSEPPPDVAKNRTRVRPATALAPASPRPKFPSPVDSGDRTDADPPGSSDTKAPEHLPQIGTPVEPVIPSVYAPKGSIPPQLETSNQPMWKQFLTDEQQNRSKKPATAGPSDAAPAR